MHQRQTDADHALERLMGTAAGKTWAGAQACTAGSQPAVALGIYPSYYSTQSNWRVVMSLHAVFLRFAPVALRVAKLIVVVAPHVLAAYQYRQKTKLPVNRKQIK